MTTTQAVSAEALDAIEALTAAADAFVTALRTAADQDTDNRGYWTGYIAQIKHVAEHGAAALRGAEVPLCRPTATAANRVRLDALSAAAEELKAVSEVVFHASVVYGRSDERVLNPRSH